MTRTEYETALAAFRAVEGGEVDQDDFFPGGRPPYRHARLRVICGLPAVAGIASVLAAMTAMVGAHLTLFCAVTGEEFWFDVMASRDLDEAEIGDDPPCATRAVT